MSSVDIERQGLTKSIATVEHDKVQTWRLEGYDVAIFSISYGENVEHIHHFAEQHNMRVERLYAPYALALLSRGATKMAHHAAVREKWRASGIYMVVIREGASFAHIEHFAEMTGAAVIEDGKEPGSFYLLAASKKTGDAAQNWFGVKPCAQTTTWESFINTVCC